MGHGCRFLNLGMTGLLVETGADVSAVWSQTENMRLVQLRVTSNARLKYEVSHNILANRNNRHGCRSLLFRIVDNNANVKAPVRYIQLSLTHCCRISSFRSLLGEKTTGSVWGELSGSSYSIRQNVSLICIKLCPSM